MALLEIELENGRKISADSCFIAQVESLVQDRESIETTLLSQYHPNRVFGEIPFHVVEPRIQRRKDGWWESPSYKVMAMFYSDKCVQQVRQTFDGSYLIIIWYQEVPFPFATESSRAEIAKTNWDLLAQNGNW